MSKLKLTLYESYEEEEKNSGESITEQSDDVNVESVYSLFAGNAVGDNGESMSKELEDDALPFPYKEDDLTNIDMLKGKKQMYEDRERAVKAESEEALKVAEKEALYKKQVESLNILAEEINAKRKAEK